MDLVYPQKVVLDCDGVLTDGKVNITADGSKLFKTFHTRDVRAIRELVANGFEVYIVSADDWGGVAQFAEKVGAEFIYLRDKSLITFDQFIAVGDDAWDIPLLRRASYRFAPKDCDPSLFDQLDDLVVLRTSGGAGVVAELVRILLY